MKKSGIIELNNEIGNLKYTYIEKTIPEDKGTLIYLHGGGFIFGTRNDLSYGHIEKFTGAGYNIFALDYPLAPETKLDMIIDSTVAGVNFFLKNREDFSSSEDYYIFGRSAGGFLTFLTTFSGKLLRMPKKIISYYGYGLFDSDWLFTPSEEFLKLPHVSYESLKIKDQPVIGSDMASRYPIYIYNRQNGGSSNILTNLSNEEFREKYSLRTYINNCKSLEDLEGIFLCHSKFDTDVPYEESVGLSEFFRSLGLDVDFLTLSFRQHDFDRDMDNLDAKYTLSKTIKFLDK